MDATTFTHATVLADLKQAVAVKVDGDASEEQDGFRGTDLAEKYGVRVFPTHVLLDGEGRVVARAPGYMEPQQFLSWFKLSLARAFQKSVAPPAPSGS
jgi:thioredoxin-related protein